MKFEQIKLGENNFEFRDQSTTKRITCRAGIRGNPSDTDNPCYPRTLAVEESSDHADEYRYIVEPLRVVFQASVQSGHPVSWL